MSVEPRSDFMDRTLKDLRRFTPKWRKVLWPPDPKSILIALNLSMDRILGVVDERRFDYDPKTACSLFDSDYITDYEWLVLLLEDRRFFRHSGFDYVSGLRLLKQICLFRRVGGVSTIEQQFVRTVLDDRRRNFARKAREVLLAYALTYRRRKLDILRTYLSIAYLGYRLRGCEEASRLFFNKESAEIGRDEGAFLASLLVYPIPKKILLSAIAIGKFPIESVEDFLNYPEWREGRWAPRMRRRVSYAGALFDSAEKPLYQVY